MIMSITCQQEDFQVDLADYMMEWIIMKSAL